ncbi:Crp/Fnr family transcriptional regulator [Candidatus Bipolaricaulota bacterium]|nr:Crp/Fnr family transcriptional regulator [Candidatus Bipolaricaulota bacterium]
MNACCGGSEEAKTCLSNIFASLDLEHLEELEDRVRMIDFKEGDLIFQEGSPTDGVFIICQGFVRYGKSEKNNGEKVTLRLVGPGEMLGVERLFTDSLSPHFGRARALVETTTGFIEKSYFLSFLQSKNGAFFDFAKVLARDVRAFEARLIRCTCNTIENNLAELLLHLGNKWGKQRDGEIVIPFKFTRKTLASIIGVSKGSVTNALKNFEENGCMKRTAGQVIITDPEGLEDLASCRSLNCGCL